MVFGNTHLGIFCKKIIRDGMVRKSFLASTTFKIHIQFSKNISCSWKTIIFAGLFMYAYSHKEVYEILEASENIWRTCSRRQRFFINFLWEHAFKNIILTDFRSAGTYTTLAQKLARYSLPKTRFNPPLACFRITVAPLVNNNVSIKRNSLNRIGHFLRAKGC